MRRLSLRVGVVRGRNVVRVHVFGTQARSFFEIAHAQLRVSGEPRGRPFRDSVMSRGVILAATGWLVFAMPLELAVPRRKLARRHERCCLK